MKSVTLLKALGVCVLSTLAVTSAQAGDSCVLSALARPAVSASASSSGAAGCGEAKQVNAAAQDQDLIASIAPLVGGMAKTGIRTASTVMRTLSHEAGRLLDE